MIWSIFLSKFSPSASRGWRRDPSGNLAVWRRFDTFFTRISSGIRSVFATFWSIFWSEFSSVRPIEPRPDSEKVWIFGPGGVPQKVAVSPETLFNSSRFIRGTTLVFGSKSGFLGFGCRRSAENGPKLLRWAAPAEFSKSQPCFVRMDDFSRRNDFMRICCARHLVRTQISMTTRGAAVHNFSWAAKFAPPTCGQNPSRWRLVNKFTQQP